MEDPAEPNGIGGLNPWRRAAPVRTRRVSLCGFFDVRGGSFWEGHAWTAERLWIAERGLVDLASRPRWRRLLGRLVPALQ